MGAILLTQLYFCLLSIAYCQLLPMPRYFWMAVSQVAAGIAIILLPGKGEALIAFNSAHAPSALDIIGLILLANGWIWLTVYVTARWKKIARSLGVFTLYSLLSVYIAGILLIIYGLKIENEILLWAGVILSSLSNLFLIIKATRVEGQKAKGKGQEANEQ